MHYSLNPEMVSFDTWFASKTSSKHLTNYFFITNVHTFHLRYKTITQSDLCRFHFYDQDCRIATGCSDSFWDFCIF